MKKSWLLFASITLAISMLSACNSANEEKGNDKETDTQVESGETNDEEKAEEVVEETEEEQPITTERGPDKTLTYSINDEVKEETATLTDSDEQNYSIYKLDGFSLTSEEPNKDSLYLDDNRAVFMRVETISKDDASLEIIANNMFETIAAVSVNKEPVEIEKDKLPQGEGISNPSGYLTTFELGTVSSYVFEQGNLIVRLTIFDQESVKLTDAFLKMGETVAAK